MRFVRFLSFVLLAFLCSCDVDLFGLDEKQIAKGYRLYRGEGMPDVGGRMYFLLLPGEHIGGLIDEVGWRKPLVVVRHGDKWDAFDTTTNNQISFSDSDRKTDLRFRDIPSFTPEKAWKR